MERTREARAYGLKMCRKDDIADENLSLRLGDDSEDVTAKMDDGGNTNTKMQNTTRPRG
jgi:hypothetical protein